MVAQNLRVARLGEVDDGWELLVVADDGDGLGAKEGGDEGWDVALGGLVDDDAVEEGGVAGGGFGEGEEGADPDGVEAREVGEGLGDRLVEERLCGGGEKGEGELAVAAAELGDALDGVWGEVGGAAAELGQQGAGLGLGGAFARGFPGGEGGVVGRERGGFGLEGAEGGVRVVEGAQEVGLLGEAFAEEVAAGGDEVGVGLAQGALQAFLPAGAAHEPPEEAGERGARGVGEASGVGGEAVGVGRLGHAEPFAEALGLLLGGLQRVFDAGAPLEGLPVEGQILQVGLEGVDGQVQRGGGVDVEDAEGGGLDGLGVGGHPGADGAVKETEDVKPRHFCYNPKHSY